jgi:hypothetical protein
METLNIYESLSKFFNSIDVEIENNHLDLENSEIFLKEKYKNNFILLKLFSYNNENITYKMTGDKIKAIKNIKQLLIQKIEDLKFLESKIEDTYIIHTYLVCDKNEDMAHLVFRFHKLSAQSPKLTFINKELGFFHFTVSYKDGNFKYYINDKKLYNTFESLLLNNYQKEIMSNHPDLKFEDSKEFLQIMQLINY